jgi:hypothetical protein
MTNSYFESETALVWVISIERVNSLEICFSIVGKNNFIKHFICPAYPELTKSLWLILCFEWCLHPDSFSFPYLRSVWIQDFNTPNFVSAKSSIRNSLSFIVYHLWLNQINYDFNRWNWLPVSLFHFAW